MEKAATINIGLDTPCGRGISTGRVLSVLIRIGAPALAFSLQQSSTELTLVAQLVRPLTEDELYDLAERCEQEAVAQLDHSTGEGLLVGEKAHLWAFRFNVLHSSLKGISK